MTLHFRAALAAAVLFSLPSAAGAATRLFVQGAAGSAANGQAFLYEGTAITTTTATSTSLDLRAGDANTTVKLRAPSAQPFAPGAYEMAVGVDSSIASVPRIGITLPSSYCSVTGGRFAVLEAVLDSSFQLARFAANFEVYCSGSTVPTYGEIRLDSSIPLTAEEGPSGFPDPFAFIPRGQLPAGSLVESNPTTIYGTTSASSITIFGGEYSINGGPYTSAPGTISNRDRLKVRGVASSTAGATVEVGVDVGGAYASFLLTTYKVGDPLTAIVLDRAAGTYAPELSVDARAPQWSITATSSAPDQVQLDFSGPGVSFSRVGFASARGAPLAEGAYEWASWLPFRRASPGIDLWDCSPDIGRFSVLEIELSGSTVVKFAADFEALCDGATIPTFGEIRYNSAVPLTSLKPAGSSLPDSFRLVAQMPVRAGAIVNAQWISLLGVNAPVPLSITGGEYSLNGGAFTAAAGVAQPRDMVTVRTLAPRVAGGSREVTLNAGGRTASMTATAYAPGQVLTGLYWRSSAGDYVGGGQTRLYLEPLNIITGSATNAGNHATFSLSGILGTWWYLDLAAPAGSPVTVGTYEGAQRYPFQDATRPGVSFSGDGAGCNQVAGRFVVREAVFGSGDTLVKFAADFEQRCEVTGPPLFGEVRFNSAIPFSALSGGAVQTAMDLDGSGKSDILYRNASTGQLYRIGMDGMQVTGGAAAYREPDLNWEVVGEGDFDGNGVNDLLWRHATNGQVFMLRFGRNGLPEGGGVIHTENDPAWRIVHTPDLDGDGKADILWWNATTGAVWAMLMDGQSIAFQGVAYSEPNTAWKIAAVGDFTGSGKRNQMVWRNAADGRVFLLTVNRSGSGFTSSGQMIYREANLSWKILAAADANGDGRMDLYWRNESTGQVYLMLMSGPVIASAGTIHVEPNLAWQVAAIGDYDGNGRADLLWRNEMSGEVYMMLMDAFTIGVRGTVYREPDMSWKVLGQSFVDD